MTLNSFTLRPNSLMELKFLLRAKVAEWSLPPQKATIITGCVRSGTTLALRISCPGLTAEEERDGSLMNEYHPFSKQIIRGNVRRALWTLPVVLQNRFHVLKSPHASFILPYVPPRYHVVVTFRDLRMIVPSMVKHSNVSRILASDHPYWKHYISDPIPEDPISEAILAAESHYLFAAKYRGDLEVWNYGYWRDWRVRNPKIRDLYARTEDTPEDVRKDVARGEIFSNLAFSLEYWDAFCAEHHVSPEQEQAIQDAHVNIKKVYGSRGVKIMTYEDVQQSLREMQ